MKTNIQIFREKKNLTQTELSEKSGLSIRTIQRIEAGNILKGHTLKSLAKALETEPENLSSDHPENIDINRAKLINTCSLTFLILPFGNIIFPAILTYKTKDEGTKALGKTILDIQIVWTIITSISMIISPFLQRAISLKFPLFIVLLIILMCTNVFLIITNGFSLSERSELSIRLKKGIL